MRKMFRFLFWVALVVGGLIAVLRLTAIRWWRVPADDKYLTASISPSVRAGDLIVLWRLTKPGFGDLVLCPEPGHPDRVVIGRLVGEPGDQVEVTRANITVNGQPLRTEGRCTRSPFKENAPDSGVEVEQPCSLEEVGGGVHERGEVPLSGVSAPNDAKTEAVPQGQVWLVSDNRLFPYDSRDYGPVERATCRETVFFRLVGTGGFFDSTTRNQYIR
jgi:signal peptidase I